MSQMKEGSVDELRVGLIGAGANVRDRHMPGFRSIKGLKVVSVVNRSPESGKAFADEFSIDRVAPSVDALLADSEIDAVCIGTWPNKHRDYTIAALEAGKHVLCEARMAMNGREAEAMLVASLAHPKLVAQIVPAPFDFKLGPTIERMIREGELGEIREVHQRQLDGGALDPDRPAHWRERRELSGNNVMRLGIYAEVLQRWLGGTRKVTAHGRIFTERRKDAETDRQVAIDVPDSIIVSAELESGALAIYQGSTVTGGVQIGEIVVYGSKARLHWQFGESASWALHGDELQPIEPDADSDRGWQVEADFVDSIRNGTPVTLTNFHDGVRYMRFIDAVHQSWTQGRAIEIRPLAQ